MNEGKNYQKVLDKFQKVTKDTLNTTINLMWTTDHKTEMPLKFISGEAGDICFDAFWLNMNKNIEDGCYADISSYLNNPDYPGLQKVFTDDIINLLYTVLPSAEKIRFL